MLVKKCQWSIWVGKNNFFLSQNRYLFQFCQEEEKQSILILLAESNFHEVNPTSDQRFPSQLVWIYHFDNKLAIIKGILPVNPLYRLTFTSYYILMYSTVHYCLLKYIFYLLHNITSNCSTSYIISVHYNHYSTL